MQKLFIKNRKGEKLSVQIEQVENQKGLGFVMHGLGGFKEQPHIQTFAKAMQDNGYTTVSFDTTNSFGESGGNYEDATPTNYYEDLEDVIFWASKKAWYQEPFILMGHSTGGICSALFAEKFPEKVKALAPISTVVSGQLSFEEHPKEEIKEWERTGWLEQPSSSKPGLMKRLKWSYNDDRMKYNLLDNVERLTMPTILIVGELDTVTPLKHQELLFDKLPGKKDLKIIAGAQHTFREEGHLKELYRELDEWLKGL